MALRFLTVLHSIYSFEKCFYGLPKMLYSNLKAILFVMAFAFVAMVSLPSPAASEAALLSIKDFNCDVAEQALSTCLQPEPQLLEEEPENGLNSYEASSIRYFLAMNADQDDQAQFPLYDGSLDDEVFGEPRLVDVIDFQRPGDIFGRDIIPRYSPSVVLYEFPPWHLTTAFGKSIMKVVNIGTRFTPTRYKSIQCKSFDQQPFGRCHVVFLFGSEQGFFEGLFARLLGVEGGIQECPIYEEFTFNGSGEITFIEAWTDYDGYLPMEYEEGQAKDYWATGERLLRLSTSIPGLGSRDGEISLGSEAIQVAIEDYDARFKSESQRIQTFIWTNADQSNTYGPFGEVGPMEGLIKDIDGFQINGFAIPGSDTASFVSSLAGRHLGADANFLNGCKPPNG